MAFSSHGLDRPFCHSGLITVTPDSRLWGSPVKGQSRCVNRLRGRAHAGCACYRAVVQGTVPASSRNPSTPNWSRCRFTCSAFLSRYVLWVACHCVVRRIRPSTVGRGRGVVAKVQWSGAPLRCDPRLSANGSRSRPPTRPWPHHRPSDRSPLRVSFLPCGSRPPSCRGSTRQSGHPPSAHGSPGG